MKSFRVQTPCRIVIAGFLLAVCLNGRGQEPSEEDLSSDPAFISTVYPEKSDPNTLKTPEIPKVSFSFSSGMMLGTAGNNNNFVIAYMAPAVSYQISPRLRVRAGGLVTSYRSGESTAGIRDNVALFVAADYFVTDRMILTGSYYKLPENSLFRQSTTPEVYNRTNALYAVPSESMSLGLNYKITKGLSFGAEFRFSNGYQPSLNPYPFMPGYTPYDPLTW